MNNAGTVNFAPIEDYTLEQWNSVIAVNLTWTFNGIKAAIPALKQSTGGSIINVSSIAGIHGYEEIPGYTASKFGIRGLTKSVALDLGRYGIRANSVHPDDGGHGNGHEPRSAQLRGPPRRNCGPGPLLGVE